LKQAAKEGHVSVVKACMEADSSHHRSWRDALKLAYRANHLSVVRYIETKIRLSSIDPWQQRKHSVIEHLILQGYADCVQHLLATYPPPTLDILYSAINIANNCPFPQIVTILKEYIKANDRKELKGLTEICLFGMQPIPHDIERLIGSFLISTNASIRDRCAELAK
jgi:hypothetical protein